MDVDRASVALCLVLVASGGAACAGDPFSQGQSEHAVVGGTIDTTDTAVVSVLSELSDGSGYLCSGSLVSPHVVLTAAHCVSEQATYTVYTGTDLRTTVDPDVLAVREVHAHPFYNAEDLEHGRDLGVVVLRDAVTDIHPIAMNRGDLSADLLGGSVRVVGYGLLDEADQDSSGVRRSVETTLTYYSGLVYDVGDATHGICFGDSGGPTLMTVDGREVIIGVASFVWGGCDKGGYGARLDAELDFVDDNIAQIDPTWAGAGDDDDTSDASDGSDDESGCSAAGGPAGTPGAILLVLLMCGAARSRSPGRGGAAGRRHRPRQLRDELLEVPPRLGRALEHRRVSARVHPHHPHVAQAALQLLDGRPVEEAVGVAPDDERGRADAG